MINILDNIVAIFCDVDDFCSVFIPEWQKQLINDGECKRRRNCRMASSELITIIIAFHQSNYREFKHFYLGFIRGFCHEYFPNLLSYNRFIEVIQSIIVPICSYFSSLKGLATGIQFIDSTSIKVCHNIRIPRHKVFKNVAKRGKGTMGYFYGFKLHIVINHHGDIIEAKITAGNVDDRKPVPELVRKVNGKLYADKGYISQALRLSLLADNVELITNVRKNMKPRELALFDKLMLKRRFIIETINDQLKNISQIEHSRHRSINGFIWNMMAGLIAYALKENKPALDLTPEEEQILTASMSMLA